MSTTLNPRQNLQKVLAVAITTGARRILQCASLFVS